MIAAGAIALGAATARADEFTTPPAPPTPAAGAVAFAWVDGSALVGTPGGDAGVYRPLATLLEVVMPGAGVSEAIAAVDGAASAGVLAGGSAWVSVDEVAVGAGGAVGVKRAIVVVNAPAAVAARVRDLMAKAGAASVKERATGGAPASVEFIAMFGSGGGTDEGTPRIAVHRASLSGDGSKGRVCAQVFVDLNVLRRSVPDAMDNTALSRVLGTWGLGNARDVMVTARLVASGDVSTRDPALVLPPSATAPEPYAGPPMVRVDVTWSARSEEPAKVSRGPLAAGYWGLGKDAGVPGGLRWVAAVRTDLGLWTVLGLRTHAARLEPAARGAYSRDVERWATVHGETMDQLAQQARGWMVLWPAGDGCGLEWRIVPGGALSVDGFGRDAAAVLSPFPAAASADAGGVRVVTLGGMVVGFAPATGAANAGAVVGRVEFDGGAGDRVRAAVGERVKKK